LAIKLSNRNGIGALMDDRRSERHASATPQLSEEREHLTGILYAAP
jgi:hypothetical protein